MSIKISPSYNGVQITKMKKYKNIKHTVPDKYASTKVAFSYTSEVHVSRNSNTPYNTLLKEFITTFVIVSYKIIVGFL